MKDKNNPDFFTLNDEINQKKGTLDFVPEPEVEKDYNKIKNFKTQAQLINYFKNAPDNSFFKALFRGRGGRIGAGLTTAIGLSLLPSVLSAEEVKQPEVKKPEVGTPIKYDSNVGAIVNENTDQPANQNQILSFVKDNPLPVVAGTSYAFAAQEVPRAYKAARELGRGKVRSALGITGALKPILTTIGTPAYNWFTMKQLHGRKKIRRRRECNRNFNRSVWASYGINFYGAIFKRCRCN